jgi:c(7)-type cytochrome triheme protein
MLGGIVVAAVVVAAGWQVTGLAETKAKPGESVAVYDDPTFATKQGVVKFSHLGHKEAFGQEKLDCKPCHMTKPPLFAMKRPAARVVVTMAAMGEGKSCGGCHNGKTVINGKTAFDVKAEDSCGRCHVK